MYRIKDLREDRDLTQAEVAAALEMSQQNYSKIETGKTDIRTLLFAPKTSPSKISFSGISQKL